MKGNLKVRGKVTRSEYLLEPALNGFNLYCICLNSYTGYCTKEECLENIKSGIWELILPDEFDFEYNRLTYIAKKCEYTYQINLKDWKGHVEYLVVEVAERIIKGVWKMVEKASHVKGIKIGDKVVVSDKDQIYLHYSEWAKRNNVAGFVEGKSVANGKEGFVVAVATHSPGGNRGNIDGTYIIAVQTEEGSVHLIGEEGVELCKECEANGYDAEGNPLNFTKDDLRAFQRVETANGRKWIVATNVQTGQHADINDALILTAPGGGWVDWNMNQHVENYIPTAVYDLPEYNNDLLDLGARGKLLWISKEHENAKRKKEIQEEIEKLNNELKAL